MLVKNLRFKFLWCGQKFDAQISAVMRKDHNCCQCRLEGMIVRQNLCTKHRAGRKRSSYRDRLGNGDDDGMQQVIHNWVRAYRYYAVNGRFVFPAYRWFRTPVGVEKEYETGEPPPRAARSINIQEAWETELAWRGLSPMDRWVLKYHFHDNKSSRHASRLIRRIVRARIVERDWETCVRCAINNLRIELASRKRNQKFALPTANLAV